MKGVTKFIILLTTIFYGCSSKSTYYRITGFAQGGTYNITYSTIDSSGHTIKANPNEIKFKVDSILLAIDNSLSGYNQGSTLSKINQNVSDVTDPLFDTMFLVSKEIYHETEGLFDPSAAPLFDIWGFGFKNKETITNEKIDSILHFVGMDKAEIVEGHILKKDPRFKLNFNAIAQGYSCDVVAAELEKLGICHYLVEVGMEIYCHGLNPNGKEWNIGVDTPEDGNMEAGKKISEIISLTNAGIVTSGNYRKFFIEEGVKYSHTIDPTTGHPVKHTLLSATVIASNATLADAYATYCMVVGLEKSKRFLESREDLKGYLIYSEGENMKVYFSENLKQHLYNQE